MPASQPYVYEHSDMKYFRVSVDDDLEPKRLQGKKSVYFTDQQVAFDVTITNLISDTTLELQLNIGVFFQHDLEVYDQLPISVTLEPEETVRDTFNVGLLPFQETGIVGISSAITSNPTEIGDHEVEISRLGGTRGLKHTLHTFSVYDRDFYRVNYWRPRWAQYIAAALAVGIIIVGTLQLIL